MTMIQLTERQVMAARKHCAPLLRKLEVKNLSDLEVHTLDWSALQERRKDVIKANRGLITRIEAAKDEAEADSIEEAADALMEALDAFDFEADQRKEIGNKEPRAQGGSVKRPGGGFKTSRGDGGAVNRDVDGVVYALAPEQRMADWHAEQHGGDDYAELSLGRYFRAMVVGAKTDAERRALSEGSDSAGGFTTPSILSARLIDLMRARQVTIAAGARTIPLTSDAHHVAKLASDPVPGWRSEAGTVTESDPTFARIELAPKSLAVLIKASRELLEDSLNLETELPRILGQALAVELDRVVLNGSGADPEPQGIIGTSGIGEVAVNAALSGYGNFVTARRDLLQANHRGPFAIVMSPTEDATLAAMVDGNSQPLMAPRVIDEIPKLITTSMPGDATISPQENGTILMGDFSRCLIGIRNEIRVEVLRERYATTMEFGFLAHLRADVAVEIPSAFVKLTGITN